MAIYERRRISSDSTKSPAASRDSRMITKYRPRTLEYLQKIIAPLGVHEILDFGAGDGYFASNIASMPGITNVTAIDVKERKHSLVKPLIYDGKRLPFADRSYDLVYAVDVVHHCLDPLQALNDMMRCARRYLLLKDHNYETIWGRWMLALLDEVGNRRFGIPSPHLYQKKWEWLDWIENNGFKRVHLIHPVACQNGPLSLTNKFQFVCLWEREQPQ